MGAFERELLMVIEAIGEQGMVGSHRHLHRLDNMLKLLDATKKLLYISDGASQGLRLLAQQFVTQVEQQRRQIGFNIFHRRLH